MTNVKELVYLGVGSNVGDNIENIHAAIERLKSHENIEFLSISSFYDSTPRDYFEQSNFTNAVIGIKTNLCPMGLLNVLQSIETDLGRVKDIRFGPRNIDLDILLYGNQQIRSDNVLIIPHERMMERHFVLAPLVELLGEDYVVDYYGEKIVIGKQIVKVNEQYCVKIQPN